MLLRILRIFIKTQSSPYFIDAVCLERTAVYPAEMVCVYESSGRRPENDQLPGGMAPLIFCSDWTAIEHGDENAFTPQG